MLTPLTGSYRGSYHSYQYLTGYRHFRVNRRVNHCSGSSSDTLLIRRRSVDTRVDTGRLDAGEGLVVSGRVRFEIAPFDTAAGLQQTHRPNERKSVE